MEETMDFDAYLVGKKIEAKKFKAAEQDLFDQLKVEFDQMHPNSFTAQKLFLINPIRRKYPLVKEEPEQAAKPKMAMRPKFKKP